MRVYNKGILEIRSKKNVMPFISNMIDRCREDEEVLSYHFEGEAVIVQDANDYKKLVTCLSHLASELELHISEPASYPTTAIFSPDCVNSVERIQVSYV